MKRYAVAVESPSSGERCWVSPSGRLVYDAWRAASYGNFSKAVELAARRPRWESVEIVEAPDRELPQAVTLEPAQVSTAPASRASDWAGTEPGIQSRRRKDGSQVFRARVMGRVSETFESLEDAQRWRESQA